GVIKYYVRIFKTVESCLAVNPTTFNRRQRYVHCSEQHYFICQKPKKIKFEDFFDIRGKLKLPLTESVNNQSVKAHSTTIKTPLEGICQEEYPEVWLRFGDYCYKFYSFMKKRPISWPESQQICEQKNAFLASIHSKEENQWILSKINSFEDNFLWIGGKYDGNSKFLWDDGTSFDYIHWAKGEPNNLNEMEECVSIRTHDEIGEWNDDHCYEKAGYICKKLHSVIMTSVKPIIFPSEMMTPKGHEKLAGGCPENWYRMDNKCVKFYDMVLMTYYEAKDFCSSLDGKATLVSIHSEKQLDAWIGLRYSILDDDFIWEDKTEVDYVHWAEFEPTMSSSVMQDLWSVEQGCVQVIVNGEEIGFWKDTDCYRQARAFVCQRPLDSKYERTLLPFPKKCSAPHDDYYSFGDYCYKFISTPLNWQTSLG
ncbi:C-type mannose receptor 2, partial [Armadillidium nasatum]